MLLAMPSDPAGWMVVFIVPPITTYYLYLLLIKPAVFISYLFDHLPERFKPVCMALCILQNAIYLVCKTYCTGLNL